MIKRISYLVILYTFLFGTAIFVQSCCNDEDMVRIVGDGTMAVFNTFVDGNPISTGEEDITGPFFIGVSPATEISDVTEFGLMSSAYATSCDFEYTNNLTAESLVLTCDRAFELGDMTIDPGTDLLDLDGVELPLISNLEQIPEVIINFTDTFIDQVVFEEVEYTFTINMSTNDGVDIVDSATAFFRL